MPPIDGLSNEACSAEVIGQASNTFLMTVAWNSLQEGLSISAADIDELRVGRDAHFAKAQQVFDAMIESAEARRRNLPAFAHIQFVSLGLDCMARVLPTRWGLKPPARLGTKTGPFDITEHLPQTLEHVIATDFADYLRPEDIEFREETNHCVNLKIGAGFVHEVGEEYRANDFQKLRDTYTTRIHHFKQMLADPRPTMLVLTYPIIYGAYQELVDGLMRTFEHIKSVRSAPTAMCCIRVNQPGEEPSVPDFRADDFWWSNVHMPYPEYVWYALDHVTTPGGVTFEKRVISHITDMVGHLGW